MRDTSLEDAVKIVNDYHSVRVLTGLGLNKVDLAVRVILDRLKQFEKERKGKLDARK